MKKYIDIINRCVDSINRIKPEIYTKEIDVIKENLETIEKTIEKKTEDINTINGKITSINHSIDALNESVGHKVSHTNSASVVYANDTGGNETPIKFTSGTDAGTIALRTSTGQVIVTDATADNHAVGYKQMQTYVTNHCGDDIKIVYPEFTVSSTTSNNTKISINKEFEKCVLFVLGIYSGSETSVPFIVPLNTCNIATANNNEFFSASVNLSKTSGSSDGYNSVTVKVLHGDVITLEIYGTTGIGTATGNGTINIIKIVGVKLSI